MALIRDDSPILEYDTAREAVIMPNRDEGYEFAAKAVFAFLGGAVERYVTERGGERVGRFVTMTKTFPVYKVRRDGREITLCEAPVGAPAEAQVLDFLIAYGVREIVAVGSCGALADLAENEWLVPVEALRDEGTSYHYLPPTRTITLDPGPVAAIASVLDRRGLPYERCRTWSTDGFFRETPGMVAHRREEGCAVVEMECAALAAVARFRGAVFGQLLYTADTLAQAQGWDQRDWGLASVPLALELALDAVSAL